MKKEEKEVDYVCASMSESVCVCVNEREIERFVHDKWMDMKRVQTDRQIYKIWVEREKDRDRREREIEEKDR